MKKFFVVVALAFVLGGGYWWIRVSEPAAPVSNRVVARENQVSIALGDTTVIADIADTPDERAQGLSGRSVLGENEGLLFVFTVDDRHSFWMKDMLISIDMIWLSSDKRVVHIVPNATPGSYPQTFSPDDPARYVLEVPAGWASRHGVTVGSVANF